MATATFYTLDSDGLVSHQVETGTTYQARAGGYGIIVIEDTMAPVRDNPLDTYQDNDLAIVMNPANRLDVAATHRDALTDSTAFHPILIIRPVLLPNVGVRIIVSLPS